MTLVFGFWALVQMRVRVFLVTFAEAVRGLSTTMLDFILVTNGIVKFGGVKLDLEKQSWGLSFESEPTSHLQILLFHLCVKIYHKMLSLYSFHGVILC